MRHKMIMDLKMIENLNSSFHLNENDYVLYMTRKDSNGAVENFVNKNIAYLLSISNSMIKQFLQVAMFILPPLSFVLNITMVLIFLRKRFNRKSIVILYVVTKK